MRPATWTTGGVFFEINRVRTDTYIITTFILLALILRSACAIFFTGTIDTEGAEYARIAQNMLAGNGYVGIASEGKQLFFPPLFPMLISGISLLTRDAEIAGRLVSVVMGTLLVVPTFLLAGYLYDRATAVLTTLIVASHPLLVQFSATVYSEPTYITLLVAAVYSTLRAIQTPTSNWLFVSGVLYGAGFLIRPESAAYVLIAGLFLLAFTIPRHSINLPIILLRLCLLPATCLAFVIPYALWLHAETGQFRVEGRSPLNVAILRSVYEGHSAYEASFGVAPDLSETGVFMKPNIQTFKSSPVTLAVLAQYAPSKAKDVVKQITSTLASNFALGSPPLFALAMLGLFSRAWNRKLAGAVVFIFAVLTIAALATFFVINHTVRYFIGFIPFLCVWAAVGIFAMSRWATETAALMRLRPRASMVLINAVRGLAVAVIAICSLAGTPDEVRSFNAASRPVKLAGHWLRDHFPEPIRLADTSTIVAFHARANLVWLPYCDEQTAIRYLDKRQVDFLVLRDYEASPPYVKGWMERGVSGHRAKEIYADQTSTGERIRIFLWMPVASEHN